MEAQGVYPKPHPIQGADRLSRSGHSVHQHCVPQDGDRGGTAGGKKRRSNRAVSFQQRSGSQRYFKRAQRVKNTPVEKARRSVFPFACSELTKTTKSNRMISKRTTSVAAHLQPSSCLKEES